MERERRREIFKTWLMSLWRLASPKSAGWTSRVETQGRASVTVHIQRLAAAEFSLVLSKTSANSMHRPTHIKEVNILY